MNLQRLKTKRIHKAQYFKQVKFFFTVTEDNVPVGVHGSVRVHRHRPICAYPVCAAGGAYSNESAKRFAFYEFFRAFDLSEYANEKIYKEFSGLTGQEFSAALERDDQTPHFNPNMRRILMSLTIDGEDGEPGLAGLSDTRVSKAMDKLTDCRVVAGPITTRVTQRTVNTVKDHIASLLTNVRKFPLIRPISRTAELVLETHRYMPTTYQAAEYSFTRRNPDA